MRLYLDDERKAPPGWTICRSPVSFMHFLTAFNGQIEEISLDHDLGYFLDGREITGYTVLCKIEERIARGEMELPVIHVHSANPAAQTKMRLTIEAMERRWR